MVSPDRKDAVVGFYGTIRSPFNLEGIKPEVDCFEQLLTQSPGRKVLYIEDATMTKETAEMSKMVIENHGLVDPLLGNFLRAMRVTPTLETLHQLGQKITSAGYRSLEMGLIPPTEAQQFFLNQELERLRSSFQFDIEYESHSEQTVKEISERLNEAQIMEGENIESWMSGRVDKIVDNKKKIHNTTRQIAVIREPDIVRDLTFIIEAILQDEEKGALFLPFTAVNRPLIYSLRRNFWENSPIELRLMSTGLEQSPEMIIQEGLQNGTPVPDEVYAQHFLETLMSVSVQTYTMSRRRFLPYAQNYETVARTISEIATSFSLPEIEELARSRKDLLDVLRAHPASAPLLPHISRLLI